MTSHLLWAAVLAIGAGLLHAHARTVAVAPLVGVLVGAALTLPPWALAVLVALYVAPVLALLRGHGLVHPTRRTLEGVALEAGIAVLFAVGVVAWDQGAGLALAAALPLLTAGRVLSLPQLRHQSRLDAKTGLFHLRHFEETFADQLASARAEARPLTILMVDVDHLRAVNNRFGHLAGDQLIEGVADVLREAVRGRGVAARFGGEEFAVLLPGHDAAQGRAVAERIRRAVAERRWTFAGDAPTSLSVGVAAYPAHGSTEDALLGAADAALYDAKLAGRNRVRVAVPAEARHALALGPAQLPPAASAAAAMAASGPPTPPPGQLRLVEVPAEPPARPEEPAAEPAERRGGHPRAVAVLAALTVLGATAVAAVATPATHIDDPGYFIALLALFVGLDHLRIDLFDRAHISPASVPVLVLAFDFGPLGPLAAEALLAGLRAARGTRLVGWSFDFGSLTLAGAAAALTFDAIGATGDGATIAAGLAGGLAYYAVNIPLLAGVMALSEGLSLTTVFRERLAWLLPQFAAFGLCAGTLVVLEAPFGWWALAFLVFPLAVMWVTERQYVDRSRDSVAELRRRSAELEAVNANLRELLGVNQELLRSMQRASVSTITSLARTIEAKDPCTGGHVERVAELAVALAAEAGITDEDLDAVRIGAVIHDVGKIGVPDTVLGKPGPLDAVELAEMRRHPEISTYILADLELPPIVKQMVRSHHERWDGGGYPDGLLGEEIPLAARVLSVSDTLDAMTSDRAYRSAVSLEAAVAEIRAEAGRQFCPRVVAALDRLLARRAGVLGVLDDAAAPVAS